MIINILNYNYKKWNKDIIIVKNNVIYFVYK